MAAVSFYGTGKRKSSVARVWLAAATPARPVLSVTVSPRLFLVQTLSCAAH